MPLEDTEWCRRTRAWGAVEPSIEGAVDIRRRVTELEGSRGEIEWMNRRLPIIHQLIGRWAVALARVSMTGPALQRAVHHAALFDHRGRSFLDRRVGRRGNLYRVRHRLRLEARR